MQHWYTGIVRAVDQKKGTRVVHYVGWPRAWDETFTEDEMRRRTRPLRVTGVIAPTGPLCRPPKGDRGITCKIEDEGTLPAAKGRPTAEALYNFDSSIDWSKRFPKADENPKPKSKPRAMQKQASQQQPKQPKQPKQQQKQQKQPKQKRPLSKGQAKSKSAKRAESQPAARRTQPKQRKTSDRAVAGSNGDTTAQTEHERVNLSDLVGKWVVVNIGGKPYKGRVVESYDSDRIHTLQWISGIYENVTLGDKEMEVVDVPTAAERIYMAADPAPLQKGRKRQRKSSPSQPNMRRKSNSTGEPQSALLAMRTHGHSGGGGGGGGGGPNMVPDTLSDSSHPQGPAGFLAPNPMSYSYQPGGPAVHHQHHQQQPHQQMQQHQHAQQQQTHQQMQQHQHAQQQQAQPFLSQTFDVHFVHNGELGLWFGCPDINGAKTVTGIKSGSQAAAVPQLRPYFTDAGQPKPGVLLELVRVNDIMVRHMPFEQALSTIKAAGRPLRLNLERIRASTPQMSVDVSLPLPSMGVPMGGGMAGMGGGMGNTMGNGMGNGMGNSMGGSMAGTAPGTMPPGMAGGFSAPGTGARASSGALGAPSLQTAHFAQTRPHIGSSIAAGPIRPAVGPGGPIRPAVGPGGGR